MWCGTTMTNVRITNQDGRVIAEWVKRANGGHLYKEKVINDEFS